MPSIDICIATYKRAQGLKKLLQSLAKNRAADKAIRVIIIDNDPEKSAQACVEIFFANSGMSYIYDTQPEKNISLTRNKALSYIASDYIAFIDDDEWAEQDWLTNMLSATTDHNADVVFGAVLPDYPENTPDWIINGGFFNGPVQKTGTLLSHGWTSNTFLRLSESIKKHLLFDPDYGITGGEDTELFHRLHESGAKLIWCNEAIVYETIAKDRMTIDWLSKRALRSGQVYAKIFITNQALSVKVAWLFKKLFYLLLTLCLLPFALLAGKARWVWVLRKLMANYGQLSTLFSNHIYQEYQ